MKAIGNPVIVGKHGASQLEQISLTQSELYDERWLQELIFKNPSLLPMDQIEPGLAGLIPICMELPLRCGYLDNLFLTPDGDVVIVEVKLWRNPEMRRAVLAQALDYASALFSMSYEELDAAVRKADGANGRSMFEIADGPDTLGEPDFIDALINRLKTGRIVVIVAGDGIRGELEKLVEQLQTHAGFRFTFALVELALFHSGNDDWLVIPRTLAKTYRIERGVIRLEGDGVAASFDTAPVLHAPRSAPAAENSISSDIFFDAMRDIDADLPRQLSDMLGRLETFGVYPEFKKSMILRWATPDGGTAQLGCVYRNGSVFFEDVATSLPNRDAAEWFLSALVDSYGFELVDWSGGKTLRTEGKPPKIGQIAQHPDGFVSAVEGLEKRVRGQ
jgi:hypothetical protein